MKKLKCPFCNETELEKGLELRGGGFILGCPKCKKFAHDVFWQALIDTKNKLDIAVDALSAITATPLNSRVIHDVGNKALEQIGNKE